MKNGIRSLLFGLLLCILAASVSFAEPDLQALLDVEDYMGAIRLCEEDGSEAALARKEEICVSVYAMAEEALAGRDPVRAAVLFAQLGNYRDADGRAFFCSRYRSLLVPVEVGDTVSFGSYEQDGDGSNGPEMLEWTVLDAEEDRLLLITRWVVDTVPYTGYAVSGLSWEGSMLRSFLNGPFADTAFSEEDKALLASDGDLVLVLNDEQLNRYFPKKADRRGVPTQYARDQGIWASGSGYCYWWLSGINPKTSHAQFVSSDGSIAWHLAQSKRRGVRPVIRLDLNALRSSF